MTFHSGEKDAKEWLFKESLLQHRQSIHCEDLGIFPLVINVLHAPLDRTVLLIELDWVKKFLLPLSDLELAFPFSSPNSHTPFSKDLGLSKVCASGSFVSLVAPLLHFVLCSFEPSGSFMS